MPENPTINFKAGLYLDQQQQAEKAIRALPAETMQAFARDHELMRAATVQELKRLIGKHGEAHPRVREKMAQAELNDRLSEVFERETDRLVKTSAERDPGQMVVHGHISDDTGRPAPKAKVELVEEHSGKPVGRAATDRLGYFRIAIEGDATRGAIDTAGLRPTADPAKDRDLHLLLRVGGEDEASQRQVIAVPNTAVYVDVVMTRSAKDK